MTSHTLGAHLPVVRRRPRRRERLAPLDQNQGTPVLRLLGTAVLGWVGLMVVVTILAV